MAGDPRAWLLDDHVKPAGGYGGHFSMSDYLAKIAAALGKPPTPKPPEPVPGIPMPRPVPIPLPPVVHVPALAINGLNQNNFVMPNESSSASVSAQPFPQGTPMSEPNALSTSGLLPVIGSSPERLPSLDSAGIAAELIWAFPGLGGGPTGPIPVGLLPCSIPWLQAELRSAFNDFLSDDMTVFNRGVTKLAEILKRCPGAWPFILAFSETVPIVGEGVSYGVAEAWREWRDWKCRTLLGEFRFQMAQRKLAANEDAWLAANAAQLASVLTEISILRCIIQLKMADRRINGEASSGLDNAADLLERIEKDPRDRGALIRVKGALDRVLDLLDESDRRTVK